MSEELQPASPDRITDSSHTAWMQLVSDILGTPLVAVLEQVVAHMEYADEEIADFVRRNPSVADKLKKAFRYLSWGWDVAAPEQVYRHHVQELLQRVVDDRPLSRGTDAEALMSLVSDGSKSKLSDDQVNALQEVFRRVQGDYKGVTDIPRRESPPAAVDRVLDTIKCELAHDRNSRK